MNLIERAYRILDMEQECRYCGNILQWGFNVRDTDELREVGASHACGICTRKQFPGIYDMEKD